MAHKSCGVKCISAGLFSKILKFNVSLGCFRVVNSTLSLFLSNLPPMTQGDISLNASDSRNTAPRLGSLPGLENRSMFRYRANPNVKQVLLLYRLG